MVAAARIAPVRFDPVLIEDVARIVADIQGADVRLPSGALHDAASVAEAGIPTVMLFVRSERGLSHTREENSDGTTSRWVWRRWSGWCAPSCGAYVRRRRPSSPRSGTLAERSKPALVIVAG